MKHLRAALECGDAIEAMQSSDTFAKMEDIGNQFDSDSSTEVSLESCFRANKGAHLVLRSSYPVVSVEALSQTAVGLIVVAITAILTFIARFLFWEKGPVSSGAASRLERTTKLSAEMTEFFDATLDAMDNMGRELGRRQPELRPNVAKKKNDAVVDVNAAPAHPSKVRTFNDVVDVVYRDIDSHDKERFLSIGDAWIAELAEKKEHYLVVAELNGVSSNVLRELNRIASIIRGGASHDIENVLNRGEILGVYKESFTAIKYGHKNRTLKDFVDELRTTIDASRNDTSMKMHGYTEIFTAVSKNLAALELTKLFEKFKEIADVVASMQADLRRLSSRLTEHADANATTTPAAQEAVHTYSAWLKDIGEYIVNTVVIEHHITTYFNDISRSLAAFSRLGEHAFKEMTKQLEPHVRSEMSDIIENTRESYKTARHLGNSN